MNPTRARISTFGVFALNGFILGRWIVNIPTIKDRTDVPTKTSTTPPPTTTPPTKNGAT